MQPQCIALLFADRVFREDNGKFGVLGIFDAFNFPQFPIVTPPWGIFILLSNLSSGKHPLTINLVHDQTDAVVLPFVGELNIAEEDAPAQINLPVNGVLLPAPGDYTLTLNLDGKQIASRRLHVNQIT